MKQTKKKEQNNMICILAVVVQGKWKLNDISSSSHAHTSLNWLSVSVYHRTNLTLEPLDYNKIKTNNEKNTKIQSTEIYQTEWMHWTYQKSMLCATRSVPSKAWSRATIYTELKFGRVTRIWRKKKMIHNEKITQTRKTTHLELKGTQRGSFFRTDQRNG